jgi:Spy/CpxP family protein refolding chaperone
LTYAGWGSGPDGGGGHGRHGGFGGPMMGGGPGMFLHVILKKLNLNSTQQQAVDQIMEKHRSDFQSKFNDLKIQQKNLEANFSRSS